MVKDKEKDTHTYDNKNKHKPRACIPKGEGRGSNNITMLNTLCIVSMNTKKGWIPLSIPTRLRKVKTQSTKKKPDIKQNQEIAKVTEGKTGNHPAKEDTDRRLPATARARNWQKLSPGLDLVQNPVKNIINNNNATPEDTKPPKDTNQTNGTIEWKRLKIVFRRTIVPETTSHVKANIR